MHYVVNTGLLGLTLLLIQMSCTYVLFKKPDTGSSYYRVTQFVSVIYSLIIGLTMLILIGTRINGLPLILTMLAIAYFGYLSRLVIGYSNTYEDNRIFVMSNLCIITSTVFAALVGFLWLVEIIEQTGHHNIDMCQKILK